MLAVPGPQHRPARDSAGGDQRVAQLDCITFSVASQVFSGPAANGGIGRNADEGIE